MGRLGRATCKVHFCPRPARMEANVQIRQSTILYDGLLGRRDKRLIDKAFDVQSIIFFIISYRLGALKILYFYYKKIN